VSRRWKTVKPLELLLKGAARGAQEPPLLRVAGVVDEMEVLQAFAQDREPCVEVLLRVARIVLAGPEFARQIRYVLLRDAQLLTGAAGQVVEPLLVRRDIELEPFPRIIACQAHFTVLMGPTSQTI